MQKSRSCVYCISCFVPSPIFLIDFFFFLRCMYSKAHGYHKIDRAHKVSIRSCKINQAEWLRVVVYLLLSGIS